MAEEDFQPSDALPPTGQDRRGLAGIGAFLPMTVPKTTPYGEVSLSDIEMGIPPALKDAYSGIMKFGALMRGELTPQDIQQLAFDTSMNVTGGSLLGSQLLPKAVPKGALGMAASKIPDDVGLGSGSLFAPETKKGRQLLVLSCSSTKCPDVGDMKAVDRYLGPIFQSLKKQGVPDNVDVAILSAKHGLIRADTKIKDYDQLMDTNRASEFKQDAGQMDRIKNTLEGYDKVVVQGGKNYKDVIRAASGDANVTEIPGGRGIGDQRKSVKSALAFSKIDTPVYHFSQNVDPGFTKFDPDKAPAALDGLGIHVGSTPKAAEDRFMDLTFGFGGRETRKSIAKEKGVDYDTALSYMELPKVRGNVK